MSFPLTPSLSGGYQQVPNPQPRTPDPAPAPFKLSLFLNFGPSRDGEYHLFISSPPTNPNPLPSPESTDTEVPPCRPRRPLFMRCTDGRYYPQIPVQTSRKTLKLHNGPYRLFPSSHQSQFLSTFNTPTLSFPRYLSPGIPMGVCLTSLATSACAERALRTPSPFPEPPAKPLLKRSHSC